MNPQAVFCPNLGCVTKGQVGKGNIKGQGGRAKLRPWPELNLVQVVKQRSQGQLTIQQRIVQGRAPQISALIQATQGQGAINTTFIERLNTTFRECLALLTQQSEKLQAGIYLLGYLYNFCTYHHSLRLPFYLPNGRRRWLQRTPAIAAGLTDHLWSFEELFLFKVPPPSWTSPKRRGWPSKDTLRLIELWSS